MSAVLEKEVATQPVLYEGPNGLMVKIGDENFDARITTVNFMPVVAAKTNKMIIVLPLLNLDERNDLLVEREKSKTLRRDTLRRTSYQ